MFANHAASALGNARLYAEIQQKAQELELLLDTATTVSSTLEPDRVLHILANKMATSVKATFCHIALLDETNQTLTIRATFPIRGLDRDPSRGRQYALADAPWHKLVIKRGETIVLRQDDPSKAVSQKELKIALSKGIQSALLVPLMMRDRILGVASLGEERGWERTPFTADRVRLCQAMADQAAVAIENARLYAQAHHEIAERKRTEEALRESEEQFRQLAENIHEVFWMISPEGQVIYVSPTYEEVWGRTCDSLYHQPESRLDAIHPADRERVIASYAPERLMLRQLDVEYRIIRTDGLVRWIRDRGFPVRDERGEVYRIAGIAEDITARKGEELAVAEERVRICREIHDAIIQELSSLGLGLEFCIREVEGDPATIRQELVKIQELLRHNIRELRHVILALRPVELGEQSLVPALEHYVREWGGRTGIETHVSAVGQQVTLPREVEVAILRLVQESLNNVRKHAAAHQVWITVDMSPTAVSLTVRDDGRGFDVFSSAAITRGLGLTQMRERAEAAGGRFEIRSTPGEGTEVRIIIPWRGTS